MKDKELLKMLVNDGWKVIRIRGSHRILQKGDRIEVVPVHGKEMPTGTANSILKRTGLK